MIVQKIWALLIGSASTVIGILRFIPSVELNISVLDASIHLVTGILFIAAATFKKGMHVRIANLLLGIFYILFGAMGSNWPHLIAGVVSVCIALLFKPAVMKS
jgi:hypothetical protein